jgi:hypothetical protein
MGFGGELHSDTPSIVDADIKAAVQKARELLHLVACVYTVSLLKDWRALQQCPP